MADIFLSYSRADRPTAHIIAEALEAEGFSVWWDKVLRAGQTYDEVTENMLRDSDVVIVLWSQTSVKSKWVRAEATLGQRGSELVPAMIEEADRPIMFELTQTADLIGWSGDRNEARWGDFVTDIKRSLDKHKEAAGAVAAEEASPVAAPQNDSTIETVFWTSIKDGSDAADFDAYLKRYPEGHYADLARNRIAALAAPVAAAATPAEIPKPESSQSSAVMETQSAPKPTLPDSEKKSSNPLPLILGGLVVLGIGGWFGFKALSGDGSEVTPEDKVVVAAEPSCSVCPEMVSIPAGSFIMGSSADEANRSGNEGPQREVSLRGFAISKTEVTWAEWQACVDGGGCRAAQGSGEGSYPVTGVSWNDAKAYTDWLSRESGVTHRLPTEAQWEYAARGGTQSAYWWGGSFNGPGAVRGSVQDTTSLTANAFGVSGMLGNVREWVGDCYVNNYADAPTDGSHVTTGDCDRRIVRGGSWKTGAAEHRAANRARFRRTVRDGGLGFRVVAETP